MPRPEQLDAFWMAPDDALGTTWFDEQLRAYAVIPIYWGLSWQPDAGGRFAWSECEKAIQQLLKSRYIEGMTEYGRKRWLSQRLFQEL
jgi:hypothetical protein